MKYAKNTTSILTALLATAAGFSPLDVSAAPYSLPQIPLIVSVRSIPNVWFQLDDSGSMDWEILAGSHFSACSYDSILRCSDSGLEQGLMRDWNGTFDGSDKARMFSFEYVTDQPGDHAYGSVCPVAGGYSSSLEKCINDRPANIKYIQNITVPYRTDWRAKSPDLNVMYFSPETEYEPWADSTTTFSNASFTAARSWPEPGETGYSSVRDLTGFQYNMWIDDKGFKGGTPEATENNVTNSSNGIVDEWDSYVRVTVTSASSFTCEKITHNPKTYFFNSKFDHEVRGINPTVTALAPSDPECVAATSGKSAAQLVQSVANWYQYYRRRTHVMRAAVGLVVDDLPEYRFGVGHINELTLNYPIPNTVITDYLANNKKMLDVLYSADRTATGTPLRRGLGWAGEYLSGKVGGLPSPIIESCQKNFTLLFSDGFWNGGAPSPPDKDVDKDGQSISGSNRLLADVARHYYQTDLRTDIDDAVPTDAFDPANWQHMVTYSVSFGLQGYLVDSDDDGWPNPPLDVDDDWTLSSNADLNKVDDMWHAAWNGRGEYHSSKSPQDLRRNVADILLDIGDRFGGAASAAANSGSISSTSKIFQAKFDTTDWHGELLAFPVSDDGTLDSASAWNSNALLSSKSNSYLSSNTAGRDVFTWNPSNGGTAFSWGNISGGQADLLDKNAAGTTDNLGDKRLLFLRGNDSDEEKNGGQFRNRDSKLGDIVNSDPVYVGFPPFFYSFDDYFDFFNTHVNRTGMIYHGANDGMFHAVRESDGEELFAYVPDRVYPKLSKLTDPNYVHEFYVDGQPEYGDVQVNNKWMSIVTSGLRSGGQGLFALDITTPDSFDKDDVLWEFTDAVDADLGYTFGQPQIKRMANDKWAILIGSGINNTEDDGNASTTGKGALFIIFIEDGLNGWQSTDYVKISVPGGKVTNPNAVFTPAAADIDGDARVDYIYMGDRFGKIWKVDVRSKTPGEWKLAFNGQPLFHTNGNHPFTDRPAVAAHPLGRQYGQVVLAGTGQFIEYADNTTIDQPTHQIYAIWDLSEELAAEGHKAFDYEKADLSKGTFEVTEGVRTIRSGTAVNWFDTDGDPDQRGWFVPLPEDGERIRRRPVLRNDLVFFTTLIPDDDPCSAGGTGWIMVLDLSTGMAPTFPVFDINSDLDITVADDLVGSDPDNPLTPVGIKSASIPNLPAFIYDDRPDFQATSGDFPPTPNSPRGCGVGSARAYTFTTQANGSILAVETATEVLSCGRQSWRSEK